MFSQYYDAVGQMPPRLKAPRWRSETPEMSDREEAPGSSSAAAIAAHKNEISRHRYQWAPPSTPPDYWHIGFPSTQQVEEINRKAAIIHEQKRKYMAAEARWAGSTEVQVTYSRGVAQQTRWEI